MKKLYVLICTILISIQGIGQTTVNLKINHLLNDQEFSNAVIAQNNLDEEFKVKRLEYYISDITLTHDGGTRTNVDDVYLLVNAFNAETFELGSFNITNLETITFNIGVSPSVNNADPTQWPSGHPLAPRSPSMHWGWTSGYRFVAFEGTAGQSFNRIFEIHALGNRHYFRQTIPVSVASSNNTASISINADYAKALNNISVSNGLITHGDYDEAITLLRLFQTSVFTNTEGVGSTLSTENIKFSTSFTLSQTAPKTLAIDIQSNELLGSELEIVDLSGKVVLSQLLENKRTSISLLNTGMYVVRIKKDDVLIDYKKQIIF